jgi:Formylglycinamide ribonucleotide amidotransferase linker domain
VVNASCAQADILTNQPKLREPFQIIAGPRSLFQADGVAARPGGSVPATTEPKITPELVAAHGLKPDEYERILALIGRAPTFTELGIFSAMWNEHCSYKSSRIHLRRLPTKAPWVIQGPGEAPGLNTESLNLQREPSSVYGHV